MKTKLIIFSTILFLQYIICNIISAQNVLISSSAGTPDASAGIEVRFTNKGILIPQLALTGTDDVTTIPSLASPVVAENGLWVYNTATAGTPPNNVIPGFYIWNTNKWVPMTGASGNKGDMQYWDGNKWVIVPVGVPGQILQLKTASKIPTWITVTANAAISGTTTICAGDNTTLTASGGITYLWSNTATTAAITVNPGSTTTYTVTVSLSASCSATTSAAVTVIPAASISGTTMICSGNSTTLTASGGGTYLWNTTATTAAITITPGSTTAYNVTVSNGTCTSSASTTVTVNSPLVGISGTTTICSGHSTTLTAAGGGTTYLWSNTATTAAITVNPGSTTTYTVTAWNGCTATTSATVTVNTSPTASISGTTTICAGDNTTLTASGGGTYLWNTTATTAAITISPGSTTTYTVTVSDGTCTASASATVTVNTATASISGTTIIHSGDITTLTASGGVTYLWNTAATTAAITVNPGSTTTYTVTVTNALACTTSALIRVFVNAADCPLSVSDIESNTYNAVSISTQCWMAENLKTTHYSDGSSMVNGSNAGDITGNYTTKYYFDYANNPANTVTYGKLYTWAAVMNGAASSDGHPSGVQGACPTGWHVPSDAEWNLMEKYLDNTIVDTTYNGWSGTDIGNKIKESGTSHWLSGNNGTNSSGYTALPDGMRYSNGSFDDIGNEGYSWTATAYDASYTWYRDLNYAGAQVYKGYVYGGKANGYSVRCVKN